MGAFLETHCDIPLGDRHVRNRVNEVAENVLGLGGRVAIADPLAKQPIETAGRYGRGRSRRFHLDDVEAWMRDEKRGSRKVAKPLRASKGDSHAWSLVASNGVATLCCQRRA
jgi:hypothetical protein